MLDEMHLLFNSMCECCTHFHVEQKLRSEFDLRGLIISHSLEFYLETYQAILQSIGAIRNQREVCTTTVLLLYLVILVIVDVSL